MPLWRFLLYAEGIDEHGRKRVPLREWLQTQDTKVEAQFYAAITTLRGTPDWEDPEVREFRPLTGTDAGLGEVRFEVVRQEGKKQVKRQLRCLGIWPADGHEFVLLNGLEKSGRAAIPPNAFSEAHRLRKWYGQGRGAVDELFK